MDMMLHLADLNAAEAKLSKIRGKQGVVTTAMLEEQEWDAFKAKLRKRSKLLAAKTSTNTEARTDSHVQLVPPEPVVEDIDEDDVDMLLSLIDTLERAAQSSTSREQTMTLSEITRALQNNKVLSTEFTATAREQTKRLLRKLREMNRIWQDTHGRWALL